MRHWQQTDPARYQAIPDPETFFTELGERVESEIQALANAIAGPDRPGETYMEKVGRLNMARFDAESEILREMVLIPDPNDPEIDERRRPESLAESDRAIQRLMDEENFPSTTRTRSRRPRRADRGRQPAGSCGRRPGARARVAANLQALRVLARLEREERSATVAEREMLARGRAGARSRRSSTRPGRSGPRSASSCASCSASRAYCSRAAHDDQRALHAPGDRAGDVGARRRARLRGRAGARAGVRRGRVHRPGAARARR